MEVRRGQFLSWPLLEVQAQIRITKKGWPNRINQHGLKRVISGIFE